MKKTELQELLSSLVSEAIKSNASDWYKPKKTPHWQKYRKSKLHPDELTKQKDLVKQKVAAPFSYNEPGYDVPVNVKNFLNSTLQSIPQSETTKKILQGQPVTKRDAMLLSKYLITIPHFPYKQPRKLMSLLILLSMENAKD